MTQTPPWNDYPRPNLKRNSFFNLNGKWDFTIKTDNRSIFEGVINVPFPPESKLSGVKKRINKDETLHYSRSFSLPENFVKEKTVLHFGAVDQKCLVYLNDVLLGEHIGGYLPFSFDITKSLKNENRITVIASDKLELKYPYGKQKKKRGGMWYTPVSGIWQTVWIESLPENNIENLKITCTANDVVIEIKGAVGKKKLTLSESGDTYEFEGDNIKISPTEKHLWTPDTPYLYGFTLECAEDKIESYFALREVGIENFNGIPKITLNRKPYLFHGLLDQGYFSDGIFLPESKDGYEKDILTAKKLGFNMLRKHIKIEPPMFYYLCDKLGMAVFQDMVNNSSYSFVRDTALPTLGFKRLNDRFLHNNKESRKIFRKHTIETVNYLYNYPSIVYYTIFNEGWGQFCADEIYDIVKSKDATRVIDSASGWFKQNKSDVISEHVYFKKIKYKPFDKPLVISEFGGYSHRVDGHVFGNKNYGYSCYEKREDFLSAVRRLYSEEILPIVKKGASALVYTQISDVEDETNGFMTYDREILKISESEFYDISEKLYCAHKNIE